MRNAVESSFAEYSVWAIGPTSLLASSREVLRTERIRRIAQLQALHIGLHYPGALKFSNYQIACESLGPFAGWTLPDIYVTMLAFYFLNLEEIIRLLFVPLKEFQSFRSTSEIVPTSQAARTRLDKKESKES